MILFLTDQFNFRRNIVINSNRLINTYDVLVEVGLQFKRTFPFTSNQQHPNRCMANKRSWKAIRFHLLSRTSEQTRLATTSDRGRTPLVEFDVP